MQFLSIVVQWGHLGIWIHECLLSNMFIVLTFDECKNFVLLPIIVSLVALSNLDLPIIDPPLNSHPLLATSIKD